MVQVGYIRWKFVGGLVVAHAAMLACSPTDTPPEGDAGRSGSQSGSHPDASDPSRGSGGTNGAPEAVRDAGLVATDETAIVPDAVGDIRRAIAVCPQGSVYGDPLSSPTMAATLVKGGFKFLEGPVWFAELGVLFLSDIDTRGGNDKGPPSLIHKLTPPGTFEDFIPGANSNGLATAPDGQILAATHDTQSLSKFDPMTKARTTIDLTYMGKHFNSPNDLTVRSDGTLYFSDPHYQLGNRQSETGVEGVYRVSSLGEVTLVDDKQQGPNGVTLSPDENTLYVSTGQGTVVKYQIRADGSTGGAAPFVDAPSPDGMTVDCAGNLYVTNQVQSTIDVYSPGGVKIGSITAVPSCTNAAFGGVDRKTLYITAGPDQNASLYSVRLDVPGYPY